MEIKHTAKGELPENNQYVLAHLTNNNWGDEDDSQGNRYWVVVKFVRGISKAERELITSDRSRQYHSADEDGNNQKPYNWDSFGASSYFGQEVDVWCELPVGYQTEEQGKTHAFR